MSCNADDRKESLFSSELSIDRALLHTRVALLIGMRLLRVRRLYFMPAKHTHGAFRGGNMKYLAITALATLPDPSWPHLVRFNKQIRVLGQGSSRSTNKAVDDIRSLYIFAYIQVQNNHQLHRPLSGQPGSPQSSQQISSRHLMFSISAHGMKFRFVDHIWSVYFSLMILKSFYI